MVGSMVHEENNNTIATNHATANTTTNSNVNHNHNHHANTNHSRMPIIADGTKEEEEKNSSSSSNHNNGLTHNIVTEPDGTDLDMMPSASAHFTFNASMDSTVTISDLLLQQHGQLSNPVVLSSMADHTMNGDDKAWDYCHQH